MAADALITAVLKLQADVNDLIQKTTRDVPDAVARGMKSAQDAVENGQRQMNDAYNKGQEKAREAGEASGKAWGEGFKLLAAGIATAFLEKLRESLTESTEFASKLTSAMAETGDSAANIQKLAYAFSSVGINGEEAQNQIVLFQRKIAETAAAGTGKSLFERAGLNVKQMATQTATQNIEILADKIRSLKEPTQQADLAIAAFGRSGAQMIPILVAGGQGMRDLGKEAEKMGAVLDAQSTQKLSDLRGKLDELARTTRVFWAEILAPMADTFLKVATAIQKLYAEFEQMSSDNKMAAVFAAIGAAAALAVGGMEAFRPILGSLVRKEVLDGLLGISRGLSFIVVTVSLAAVAWKTNFAGMQTVIFNLWAAIQVFWKNGQQAFKELALFVQVNLLPVWNQLEDALKRLFTEWGDFIDSILESKETWDIIEGLIGAVVVALQYLLGGAKNVANFFSHDFGSAVSALSGLITFGLVVAIGSLVKMITTQLIPAIVRMWTAFITGEALSGVGLLAIALGVLVTLIVLVATHWNQVEEIALKVLKAIVTFVENVYKKIAEWYDWLGKIIDKIPGLGAVAKSIHDSEDAARKAADGAAAWAKSLQDVIDKKAKLDTVDTGSNTSAADFNNKENWSKDPKTWLYQPPTKSSTGTSSINPPAGPDKTGLAIKALTDQVVPFQLKVEDAKDAVSTLDDKIKALGKIDSKEKLAKDQELLNEKIRATKVLAGDQLDLMKKEAAVEATLKSRSGKEGSRSKDQEAYFAAYREMHTKRMAAEHEYQGLLAQDKELRQEEVTKAAEFYKSIADDKSASFDDRLKAANNELFVMIQAQKKGLATQQEVNDAAQHHVEILREEQKLKADAANSKADIDKANRDAAKTVRDAQNLGPDITGVREHQRAIADAQSALDDANAAAAKAARDLKDAQDALADAQRRGVKDTTADQTAVNTAQAAQITSTAAVTKAQIDLANATQSATAAVNTKFKDLINQMGGPLLTAVQNFFQLLQQGATPLQLFGAFFVELFQKSKSYTDIMTVMTAVTDKLAQIFDALRPVIDLLLGVLIGITNVFLTMFNILADLLNLFGAHIDKIKLLNANIDQLNGSIPLLQIAHELPTANEYNAGKWKGLNNQAQNGDPNAMKNDIFRQQLTKLGSIFGTLLGILLFMHVIHTVGVALQMLGNRLLTAANLTLNRIAGILGMHTPHIVNTSTNSTTTSVNTGTSASMGIVHTVPIFGTWINTFSIFTALTALLAVLSLFHHAKPPAAPPTPTDGPGTGTPAPNTGVTPTTDTQGVNYMNLNQLFGNGSTITSANAGFSISGNGATDSVGAAALAGAGGSSTSSTGDQTQGNLVVNIQNLNGTDPQTVKTMFQPILEDWSRRQNIATRTLGNQYGRM